MLLELDYVVETHDSIIAKNGGLPGFASGGVGGVEAALGRVDTHAYYRGLDDAFGIAAMYAVAIARGHVFNDANKRTGLACALAYLDQQDITIAVQPQLEEVMVEVAQGVIDQAQLADILSTLWEGQAGNPGDSDTDPDSQDGG